MTAVEFLMKKIMDRLEFVPMEQTILKDLYYEAIEMEKQQMFKGSELETFEISDEEILETAKKLSNIDQSNPLDSHEKFYRDYKFFVGIVLGMQYYRDTIKLKKR
jgi:hypothetical protein